MGGRKKKEPSIKKHKRAVAKEKKIRGWKDGARKNTGKTPEKSNFQVKIVVNKKKGRKEGAKTKRPQN